MGLPFLPQLNSHLKDPNHLNNVPTWEEQLPSNHEQPRFETVPSTSPMLTFPVCHVPV